MKQRIVLLVLFSLIGVSCDPSNPVASVGKANFLPLAAGNTWVYASRVIAEGMDTTVPVTVTLGSPFTYDGITWYGANDFCRERGSASPLPLYCAAWGEKDDKVFSFQQGPGPIRSEYEVLLDFPLWFGKSWVIKSFDTTYATVGGDTVHILQMSRRTARGLSTVIVPADSFAACIEVFDATSDLYEYRRGNGTRERYFWATLSTEWFAENVGMVKQIVESYEGDGSAPWRTETRALSTFDLKNR